MRYVIIGNSAAGVFAAEAIRQQDKTGSIQILTEEEYPVYARCLTSYYLTGDLPEAKLFIRPADFYTAQGIDLCLGQKVVKVDSAAKEVLTESGQGYPYDKLLIATGASPVIPKIPGVEAQGVFGLRTLADAKGILAKAKDAKQAVIVGGGFVAMKAAYALKKRGLEVTCVISSAQILSQMLDQEAAELIAKTLVDQGMGIRYNSDVAEILRQNGAVKDVLLTTGEKLPADVVIIGKGVNPNTSCLTYSGIAVDKGVLVNEYLQTNISDIYAAGDVAQGYDLVSGQRQINALWPNATEQGTIAGKNMAGSQMAYAGSIGMNSADFYGVSTIAAGAARAAGGEYEVVKLYPKPGHYRRLVFQDDYLVGYCMVGETAKAGVLTALIKDRTELKEGQAELRQGRFKQKILW